METETAPTPELYTTTGDMGGAPTPELINEVQIEDMPVEEYMEMQGVPMDDDYYVTTSADMNGASTAMLAGFMGIWMVLMFAVFAIMIVAFWKIFTKAGEEGWKSIIPIYNTWVLLEISGKPGWWLFLMFIPFVNIIILIMMYDGLSKSFGKGIGYTLGLLFLSPIFFLMLAFGNAKHIKVVESDNGPTPPQDTPPQNPTPQQVPPIQSTPNKTI